MMFLGLRKLGNICCGHKMFLNKIKNIFVSRTQNLCLQQMLRARAKGETFVLATMCPCLPGPLGVSLMPACWKLRSHAGSRLRANFSRLIEKCDLLPSCHVNSDPWKERKPCVKWINDNIFLVISDFWSEKHREQARIYTGPKTSEDFGCLRKTSDDFGLFRKSSEMIKSSSKIVALRG